MNLLCARPTCYATRARIATYLLPFLMSGYYDIDEIVAEDEALLLLENSGSSHLSDCLLHT